MDLREDQLEPYEVTLTEMENIEMEVALTIVSGRQLEQPGKKAIETLRQQEPKPPLVTKVNIVVKILDPIQFPTLSQFTNQMLQDLRRDGILNDVIGCCVQGKIRELRIVDEATGKVELVGQKIGSYNIVPKESYMYTLTLPNYHFLMLRHLRGKWFRCLAYFCDHDSYTNFLNIFYTNKISF
ncbi:hypothetical protein RhiirA4_548178 [Rhizophagus irregularis]|uniref:Uncharacterized protein n=1 Tax=Rhizophagus irregularis TaxID=588596 RepID=A0A2I1H652_9GLOM|nr:hypothetical protein RhiirA4_548178 [Rhizophagus irregularis]